LKTTGDKVIQGTKEWHELRRKYIGCSDIPIILGLSPYKTPRELWLEKIGKKEPDGDNEYTLHGKEKEPIAREKLGKILGITLSPEVVFSKDYHFLMSSLDGVDFSGNKICEIKCPFKRESYDKRAKARKPNEIDFAQMQGQMLVNSVENIIFFCYWKDEDFFISECHRDNKFIEDMIPKLTEFYECMVNEKEPPDKYIRPENMDWELLAAMYRKGRALKEEGETIEREAKTLMVEYTGGKAAKGSGIRLEASLTKGVVDYKSIPELSGVDLERYRKPSYTKYSVYLE